MPVAVIMAGQEVIDIMTVPEGATPYDITALCNPETKEWEVATICMTAPDNALLREEWKAHKLYGKETIVFASSIQGGGKGGSNPLQAVFTIALIAAAMWAGPFAAAALGLEGTFATVTSSLVSSSIMLGGGILSSAIFSQPTGQIGAIDNQQASPTYSLGGTRNIARLGQPIPFLLGKMKVVPDVGATQYTQYIDNEMYLYQVFMCGLGKIDIHELEYGDIVFWKDGAFVDSAYSSETGEQYTNTINQELVAIADGGKPYGNYRAVRSADCSMTLRVNLSFPQGLCTYYTTYYPGNDHRGESYETHTSDAKATFVIRSREIDSNGSPLTEWVTWDEVVITERTANSFTRLITHKEERYGQYEIEVTNTSQISDENNPRKKVVLSSVSSIGMSIALQIVDPGEKVTLFPDNVESSSNVSSQELYAPNDKEQTYGWTGGFVTNSPGTQTNQILFSFSMPSGIGHYNNKGGIDNYTLKVEIQLREIDDYNKPLGEWKTILTPTYTAATLTAQRKTEKVVVKDGRYEARVRRISNKDTANRALERIEWESMVAILPGSLSYAQTAIAIKVKASNVLSNDAASNFKVLATRKLPTYNRVTKKWEEDVPTRSFASAICYVAKTWGGLTDRRIDLDRLWAIDEELATQGWYFDAWVDGAYSVWQLIIEMCEGYRVVPRLEGAILSFVVDKADRPIRHIFTTRNIVRGSFNRTFNTFTDDTPDDVNISYLDEEANYAQREVRATLPESESTNTASRNYLGVCSRDHAHKIGLFKSSCNRFRRLSCEFETEGVGRLLNLGDVIAINHPRFSDTCCGAIDSWNEQALSITADISISSLPATAYISFNRPNGTVWGPCKVESIANNTIILDTEDYALLKAQGFESPFTWFCTGEFSLPTVFSLLDSKEHSRRYIITGIAPSSLYKYSLTCINDDKKVDAYWDIPTPPWTGRSNTPISYALSPPTITSIDLTNLILNVAWNSVTYATAYEVEISADGATWIRHGQTYNTAISLSVGKDTVWFRVSSIKDNEKSSWTVIKVEESEANNNGGLVA